MITAAEGIRDQGSGIRSVKGSGKKGSGKKGSGKKGSAMSRGKESAVSSVTTRLDPIHKNSSQLHMRTNIEDSLT
jgi:hypothetical protein